jgi:hypothetical protein
VLYLTSDAGEEDHPNHALARVEAQLYKKKQDWLLVPVSLGSEPSCGYDDVVIGTRQSLAVSVPLLKRLSNS